MPPTEALARIADDFEAFRKGVERCRSAEVCDSADLRDAYSRFNRLKDRYRHEKPNLNQQESKALSKVFNDDKLTVGINTIRNISEHVKTNDPTIRTTYRSPILLTSESSARSMFTGVSVLLCDVKGNEHHINHIELLTEMERSIEKAIANCSS